MSLLHQLHARARLLGITDPQFYQLLNQAEAQYHRELCHDELTGLLNERGFVEQLAAHISLVERIRSAVTFPAFLAYGDLDNFKAINDRFGHTEGDRALRHVAHILAQSIREGDIVARFHGDEFVLALMNIPTPDDAQLAISRIQDILSDSPFPVADQQVPISMTIGLAPCDLSNHDSLSSCIQGALHTADQSMLAQKTSR